MWFSTKRYCCYCTGELDFLNGSRERNEVKRPDIACVIRSLRYASFPAAIE